MPPDLSPAAWLTLLLRRLEAQNAAVRPAIQYFDGLHKLAWATAKFRQAFSRYYPPMATNWMKLVVNAPVARLEILGFRFDPDPTRAAWDDEADQEAWRIWQYSNMDAQSIQAHREAIKTGVAYALVTPAGQALEADTDDEPLITVELPEQCYVLCNPANRRDRWAAIKRWTDDVDGYMYAYVYLRDWVYRWRSVEKVKEGVPTTDIQWRAMSEGPVANTTGVVPMIPIENDPDPRYGGRSDLEEAMPIQDAINKYCLDMMVSSEFHAYPQRWASGWEKAVDAAGNEVTADQVELMVGVSRFLRSNSKDTQFGTLTPGDVGNYIKPIEMFIETLAAITQTPAYYLKGQMANLSAEAIQAADAGLIERVGLKIKGGFSDAWEETMRVAFLAKGDLARGRAFSAEALWANPAHKQLPQVADALVKLRAGLNIPIEMAWEELGWSPQKIRQGKKLMNLPDGGPPIGVPNTNPMPNREGPSRSETTSPGGVIVPGR